MDRDGVRAGSRQPLTSGLHRVGGREKVRQCGFAPFLSSWRRSWRCSLHTSLVGRSGPSEGTIVGTEGDDDPLRGTPRDDVICARAGNDRVPAGGGDDTLFLGRGMTRALATRATT